MFLAHLLTLLQTALDKTFDEEYPEADFRQVKVSLNYPADKAFYPGIWIDFTPVGELESIGIAHLEYSDASETGHVRPLRRWTFQGYATYTVVALTSLERARLFDEMVRVMAFGDHEGGPTAHFRRIIENNNLIAANIDFDQIGIGSFAAVPGTPWGTDEIVYEGGVTMEVLGEFVSDSTASTLVPLSEIRTYSYPEGDPDPTLVPPPSLDNAQWH